MADPIARYPFSGTANYTTTLASTAHYIVVFNDGSADITVKAGQFQAVVKAGDALDERVDPFTTLSITGTSAYRGYVRVIPGGVG
ncbi:hypothetical protein [Paenibacillus illinoisensis]|uniref:hypothetical protein n=1 Tax=Paenibacillus illinoisensis TaxID=59845 RepID=UPI002041D37E|nr:hypothetical protein [Paenibacillus illinoisensis]MCM3205620.1 hypothetical protein [Paenibacillus illinoisensis]